MARKKAERACKERSVSERSYLLALSEYPQVEATRYDSYHQKLPIHLQCKTSRSGFPTYFCVLKRFLAFIEGGTAMFPTPARLAASLKILDIWINVECKKCVFPYYTTGLTLLLSTGTSPRNKICLGKHINKHNQAL